jgi:hypothetical protein
MRGCALAGSSNILRKNRLAAEASRLAEQEIDGLPCGIHGSVQVSVLPFDPDVGFIDTIALIGPFQMSAAALVQFRPVDLEPAPNATGVDEHTTFARPGLRLF